MKGFKLIIALGALVSAALGFAQDSKPMGVSVRGGFFLPTAQRAKASGRTWFDFGVDYKLKDLKYASETGQSASYGISMDLTSKNDFRQVPIVLHYRATIQDKMYYVVGAGLNFTSEVSTGTNPRKESKLGFAYQVGLGMDLKASSVPTFVEARYMGSSRSQLNGLGIFFGARF